MAFCFLQWLSDFPQWLSTFFKGFLLSSTAFQFSSTAFWFSSTAFHFPRNPKKIYLRRQVYERSLFELSISRHSLPKLCNARNNVYISPTVLTTTTTHNNQHEPMPPYPPPALALYPHGRAAVPPTHGAAASYRPTQGACRWVRRCRCLFSCLRRQYKPHWKIERKAGPWP